MYMYVLLTGINLTLNDDNFLQAVFVSIKANKGEKYGTYLQVQRTQSKEKTISKIGSTGKYQI